MEFFRARQATRPLFGRAIPHPYEWARSGTTDVELEELVMCDWLARCTTGFWSDVHGATIASLVFCRLRFHSPFCPPSEFVYSMSVKSNLSRNGRKILASLAALRAKAMS